MGAKTVFILGAGASTPYGYPTGKELRREICGYAKNLKWNEIFNGMNAFCNTFHKSSIESIDLFLSKNPNFERIGKIAIAISMAEKEKSIKFREDAKDGEDWYTYLYNKLLGRSPNKDSYHEFNINDYSFITFNYDRSLEYFIGDSFFNSYGLTPLNKLIEHLNKLKIWHVYGKLALLPWQEIDKDALYNGSMIQIEYRHIFDEMLLPLSNNIKTIHDDQRADNVEIKQIKEEIKGCTNIIFLGFGFAEENMNIIGLPDILYEGKTIRTLSGTTTGISNREFERLKGSFEKQGTVDSRFDRSDKTCLKYLKEDCPWLS